MPLSPLKFERINLKHSQIISRNAINRIAGGGGRSPNCQGTWCFGICLYDPIAFEYDVYSEHHSNKHLIMLSIIESTSRYKVHGCTKSFKDNFLRVQVVCQENRENVFTGPLRTHSSREIPREHPTKLLQYYVIKHVRDDLYASLPILRKRTVTSPLN